MATRYGDAAGGLPTGTLYGLASDFTGGVTGDAAITMQDAVVNASGGVLQNYIELFDITINFSPVYVDVFSSGIDGTAAIVMEDAVTYASEASGYFGTAAITMEDAVVTAEAFAGPAIIGTAAIIMENSIVDVQMRYILPIIGVANIIMADAVVIAGAEVLGKKVSKVRFQDQFTSNVTIH